MGRKCCVTLKYTTAMQRKCCVKGVLGGIHLHCFAIHFVSATALAQFCNSSDTTCMSNWRDTLHTQQSAQCTGQSEWMVMCLSRSPCLLISLHLLFTTTRNYNAQQSVTVTLHPSWQLDEHWCCLQRTRSLYCRVKGTPCFVYMQQCCWYIFVYRLKPPLLWSTTAMERKCCVTLKYNCNTKKMLCYFEVQLQYKENVVLLWSTTAIQRKCCVTLKYNCNTRKMLCYFEVELQYKENVVFLWSTTAMGRKCCVSLNIIIIIGLLWLTINFKMNFADMIYSWDKLMHRRNPFKVLILSSIILFNWIIGCFTIV